MQAGRELDEQVTEALGWEKEVRDGWWVDQKGFGTCPIFDFKPSTTWEAMGVLIEEARKQGILIDIETLDDRYRARAFRWNGLDYDEVAAATEGPSAPHVVCDVFLQAKGTEA
jgi:hypothetical protein